MSKIRAGKAEIIIQQQLEWCAKELARLKESYAKHQISASEYFSCCRSLAQAIKELGGISDS
jgi:hypothetical protein